MVCQCLFYTHLGGGGVGQLECSIHKAKGVGTWMHADGSASELGGIMEVAMWLCALLLVGL